MIPLWALSLLGGIGKGLKAMLAFVSKPPGTYIALVALVFLAFWWSGQRGYNRGHTNGTAECEAAHTAAAVREGTRQEKAGTTAVIASEKRTIISAAQNNTNREIVADAKARAHDLPPPPPECPAAVPPGLADRLRALR